jgi:hypothetical protein
MKPDTSSILELIRLEFQDYPGIFIGEDHTEHAARDFILSHLQELKKLGVTTIYMEAPYTAIEAVYAGEAFSKEAAKRTGKPLPAGGLTCLNVASALNDIKKDSTLQRQLETIPIKKDYTLTREVSFGKGVYETANTGYENLIFLEALVKKADELGIQVIGHDIRGRVSYAGTYETIKEERIIRDIGGAERIKATAPKNGKYIIIGGSDHSQEPTTIIIDKNNRIKIDAGLPYLLKIGSIDFTPLTSASIHRDLTNDLDHVSKEVNSKGWALYTLEDGTADYAVIHAPGLRLANPIQSELPAKTVEDELMVEYKIPKALLNNPICQNPDEQYDIIPPARRAEIIRTINAKQGSGLGSSGSS